MPNRMRTNARKTINQGLFAAGGRRGQRRLAACEGPRRQIRARDDRVSRRLPPRACDQTAAGGSGASRSMATRSTDRRSGKSLAGGGFVHAARSVTPRPSASIRPSERPAKGDILLCVATAAMAVRPDPMRKRPADLRRRSRSPASGRGRRAPEPRRDVARGTANRPPDASAPSHLARTARSRIHDPLKQPLRKDDVETLGPREGGEVEVGARPAARRPRRAPEARDPASTPRRSRRRRANDVRARLKTGDPIAGPGSDPRGPARRRPGNRGRGASRNAPRAHEIVEPGVPRVARQARCGEAAFHLGLRCGAHNDLKGAA